MKILVRFSLYLVGCSLIAGAGTLLLCWLGYRTALKENGLIEWLSAVWLLLSSLLLLLASRNSVQYARLFAVLWLLPLIAAVRELDRVFDKALFHGAWFLPAVLLMCLAYFKVCRSRGRIKLEFIRFVQTQEAVFLWLGFFTAVVFAQMFGQQAVMRAVFREHYVRSIGGFIEEIIEFLGYIILVIGSLECYLRRHDLGEQGKGAICDEGSREKDAG